MLRRIIPVQMYPMIIARPPFGKAYAAQPRWMQKIPGLSLIEMENFDRTKLNIDMSAYGLGGNELEEKLMKEGIFIELVTGNIVMCMSGIGNVRSDYEKLLSALKKIAEERQDFIAGRGSLRPEKQPKALTKVLEQREIPKEKEFVQLSEAAGRVCASSLIPYPPGIPIACPGEVIDEDVIEYIKKSRKADEKVIGLTSDNTVCVGKQ